MLEAHILTFCDYTLNPDFSTRQALNPYLNLVSFYTLKPESRRSSDNATSKP